jgi:hypothetical protein
MANLIFFIITTITKILIYGINGIIKVIFFSTTQQKFMLIFMFLAIQVDAVCFYPYGYMMIHVVIAFAPFVYLYNLGRSESV